MKTKELSITWRQFLRFGPCYEREELKAVREVAKRLKRWTALDILGVEEFSIEDRLWLVLRPELIHEKTLHLLACDFAERALKRERKAGREPDARSWRAIMVKRLWVDGKASDDELFAAWAAAWAAWAAARDAAWAAAGDAWAAAGDAARDAAGAAARDAGAAAGDAWDAASRWQLAHVRKALKKIEAMKKTKE